jgi:hypothetical protein
MRPPTSDESIGVGGERLAEGGTRGVRFCRESSEQDQNPLIYCQFIDNKRGFCQPIEREDCNLQAIIGIARNKPAEPVRDQVFDAAQVV